MKKTSIKTGVSNYYLYVGVDAVYGEFILETGGDPTTLNELEDAQADDQIETINNIIADPNTYWESCDDDDEKYVSKWLNIWRLA